MAAPARVLLLLKAERLPRGSLLLRVLLAMMLVAAVSIMAVMMVLPAAATATGVHLLRSLVLLC
jgi:hypothetical protein